MDKNTLSGLFINVVLALSRVSDRRTQDENTSSKRCLFWNHKIYHKAIKQTDNLDYQRRLKCYSFPNLNRYKPLRLALFQSLKTTIPYFSKYFPVARK